MIKIFLVEKLPCSHLFVQNQQWNHENNVLKVYSEDIRTSSFTAEMYCQHSNHLYAYEANFSQQNVKTRGKFLCIFSLKKWNMKNAKTWTYLNFIALTWINYCVICLKKRELFSFYVTLVLIC